MDSDPDPRYCCLSCCRFPPTKCFLTCVRGMLSSAHVLAMDAKNLLDVVDSIRVQYPRVNQLIAR